MLRSSEIKPLFVDLSLCDKSLSFRIHGVASPILFNFVQFSLEQNIVTTRFLFRIHGVGSPILFSVEKNIVTTRFLFRIHGVGSPILFSLTNIVTSRVLFAFTEWGRLSPTFFFKCICFISSTIMYFYCYIAKKMLVTIDIFDRFLRRCYPCREGRVHNNSCDQDRTTYLKIRTNVTTQMILASTGSNLLVAPNYISH